MRIHNLFGRFVTPTHTQFHVSIPWLSAFDWPINEVDGCIRRYRYAIDDVSLASPMVESNLRLLSKGVEGWS